MKTYAGSGPAHHKAKAKAGRQTTSTVASSIATAPGTTFDDCCTVELSGFGRTDD